MVVPNAIRAELQAHAAEEAPNRVHKIGVTSIPKSGGNDEVLKAHGLDAEGIAAQVRRRLGYDGACAAVTTGTSATVGRGSGSTS